VQGLARMQRQLPMQWMNLYHSRVEQVCSVPWVVPHCICACSRYSSVTGSATESAAPRCKPPIILLAYTNMACITAVLNRYALVCFVATAP
jgi:hypothetical protein